MGEIRYRAFLVGNCEFSADPEHLPRLKGPRNDLEVLGRVLTDDVLGLYRPENVIDLLDAPKDTVMQRLSQFLREARADDQILFYYSGHGWLDLQNRLYLCFRDTHTQELARTAIPDVLLNIQLEECLSRRIVVILDCCHSGRFKGGDGAGSALPLRLKGEGRYVMTSSRADQVSRDAQTDDAPSAFTHFLVQSLLSPETDTDEDGYVSITEAYDYVLQHLFASTKQRAQAHFDKIVGNLALGRSAFAGTTVERVVSVDEPVPVLAVSESAIELSGVRRSERLRDQTIAVFNTGGGRLDWVAECSAPWVEILPDKSYFKVRLTPQPGTQETVIVVRDRGKGGVQTIEVRLEVEPDEMEPRLGVLDSAVSFGVVRVGESPPSATIRLANDGGGTLEVMRVAGPSWISARAHGGLIELTLDTARAGELRGEIEIETNGGKARVGLSADVEPGPLLAATPQRVDFGDVYPGRATPQRIAVRNEGRGGLEWSLVKNGDFFAAKQEQHEIIVSLRTEQPGRHRGSILITSNGGAATIDVHADVRAPARPPTPAPAQPQPQPSLVVPGRWQIDIHAFGLTSTMVLDLFANGQLTGEQEVFGIRGTLMGGWAFNPHAHTLDMQLAAQVFGIAGNAEYMQIRITRAEGQNLLGQDAGQRQFVLRRIG
jgi:hypothetical protein